MHLLVYTNNPTNRSAAWCASRVFASRGVPSLTGVMSGGEPQPCTLYCIFLRVARAPVFVDSVRAAVNRPMVFLSASCCVLGPQSAMALPRCVRAGGAIASVRIGYALRRTRQNSAFHGGLRVPRRGLIWAAAIAGVTVGSLIESMRVRAALVMTDFVLWDVLAQRRAWPTRKCGCGGRI